MSNDLSVAVIDAGNTAVKTGVFENGILVQADRFDTVAFLENPNKYLGTEHDVYVISSVLGENNTHKIINTFTKNFLVNSGCQNGLVMAYESPLTLGIDRLCNAVAIRNLSETVNAVSIDIGTCVKFDAVQGKVYMGGSISPGVDLRFKSLNDYTANLPLIEDKNPIQLIGNSTHQSIRSGVMNGMKAEIQGMIDQYCNEMKDLTFFITGGDASFFDFEGKNNIFADENLTLKGLYYIYLANVH